jgi:hypothetical protein
MDLILEKAKVVTVDPEKRTFTLLTLKTRKEIRSPFPVSLYRAQDGTTGLLYIPQVGDVCIVLYDTKSPEVYVLGFICSENLINPFPFPIEQGDIIFVGGENNYVLMNKHGLIRLIGSPMCRLDLVPQMAKEMIRAFSTQFDFQTPYWAERIIVDDFGYNYRFQFNDSSTAIPAGYFFVYEVFDSTMQPRLSIRIDRLGKLEYQSGLVKMTVFNNNVNVNGIIQLNFNTQATIEINTQSATLNASQVDVKAQKINLGSSPNQPFVLGNILNTFLSSLITWLTSHTHPTAMGPSGPPAAPPPQLPNILSQVITGQ